MKAWMLTEAERKLLSADDLKKYDSAVAYTKCEDAGGPFGGWSDGYRMLAELGWEEKRVPINSFRSKIVLTKPVKYTITPAEGARDE